MRRLGVLVLLSVCLASCNGSGATSAAPGTTGGSGSVEANATIEHLVDGDTVDVEIGGRTERVRFIGVDTPETKKPDTPIQCFGPEASAFTARLLPVGTPVRIERDVVGRDDYGRLLGYVYRAVDGIFVNYELMRQGYAQTLSIAPNDTYAQLFADAARAAEADDTGLWAACRS